MADEAEKLINLSLCKMAESRTIRRGGTSLHKHLLISTVLTKARSAYFETWYMGDGEIIDERNGHSINLNSSYQELEFPLDDEDDDDASEFDLTDPSYYEEMPSLALQVTSASPPDLSAVNNVRVNDKKLTDAQYFVGTDNESEIELPSDILSCVEKMGDISDMSFGVEDNISASSSPPNSSTSVTVVSTTNVLIDPLQTDDNCSQPTQLVYLDLDSVETSSCTTVIEEKHAEASSQLNDDSELIFGSPCHTSTPRPNAPKRRRNWSLEEDSDDEDRDKVVHGRQSSSKFPFFHEIRNNAKITGVTKRLRFSPEKEEEGDESDSVTLQPIPRSNSPTASSASSIIMSNEFRTKKSHFEEDEQEDSDDDPFLGDAVLSQNPYDPNSADGQIIPRRKNDQRVPSASGGSSSDEDQDGDHGGESESSMEVDQITNLVQFISFNKNQTQEPQQPVQLPSPASSPVTSTSPAASTCCGSSSSNLVRSMSSPDLCGFVSSQSSASNAKNIFTYNRSSNNNNHNNSISHRVLTMKV